MDSDSSLQADVTSVSNDAKLYRKIGGWLLVYVIVTAGGILYSLTSTTIGIYTGTQPMTVWGAVGIVQVLLDVIAIIWLVRLDWRGVRLTRITLVLSAVINLVMGTYSILMAENAARPLARPISLFLFAVFLAIIYSLLLRYFFKSRRVIQDTLWHHRPAATSASDIQVP